MDGEITLEKTSKTKKLKRKKTASSEDQSSEDEPIVTSRAPYRHFLVMQPIDENQSLTALSPFLIGKFFKSTVGTVKVTPMRSGSLLIETDRPTYAALTHAIKEIAGIPVRCDITQIPKFQQRCCAMSRVDQRPSGRDTI